MSIEGDTSNPRAPAERNVYSKSESSPVWLKSTIITQRLGTVFAAKRYTIEIPLASIETYRIRKNLNLQSNWMYNIKMKVELNRPETTQAIRFYPLSVYIFGRLIER